MLQSLCWIIYILLYYRLYFISQELISQGKIEIILAELALLLNRIPDSFEKQEDYKFYNKFQVL